MDNDLIGTPVIIALFVVLITFILLLLWKRQRSSRTDILLTGLCDSGKTYLFSQLLYDQKKETFTSIAENIGEFKCDKGELRIVDIPGHERLRPKFFDKYKTIAKGIVFVIDSVTLQKDIRDVVDYLYKILTDNATMSIPLLVLCNKQDETMAKGSAVIKNLLEKELNLIRTTRTNQLKSVDNNSGNDNNVFLGKQGKDFEFNQLSQNIQIIEGSALQKDFTNLNIWLNKMI